MDIKMGDKDVLKDMLSEDKGILPTTDATSTTSTTKINPWGYIDLERKILLEQVSKTEYIYNIEGETGVARLQFECPSCATIYTFNEAKESFRCSCKRKLNYKEHQGLMIKGHTFKLDKLPKDPLYLTPDGDYIKEFLAFPNRRIKTEEVFREIVMFLMALFSFTNKSDAKKCALAVLFTYLLRYFNSSFYIGIDATKGSGKTTLLEILAILCRHGFLADVSPASIPRLKEKYDLNIFIDEIDQLKNGEDIEGLLRKGQRRGNKYTRLNKNTLDEEI
ncbi:hypothetical protein CMI45_01765, partial [Candidatus Pacearchaeota archaeon]|nr:hypothetical protein [Candidatus Pacearchaeota archaeon]